MTDGISGLAHHRGMLEQVANDLLAPYLARIEGAPAAWYAVPKEINDAIWGTLGLSGLEVLIVDSPLLQRLRSIRQLGVVHLVYPTAVHTRFEHALGVVHKIQHLITAFNSNGDDEPPHETISPQLAKTLRLAALCHDVGHGVMSHVSENALQYSDAVEDLLSEFESEQGVRRTLGEINSFILVGSPAFGHLLRVAQQRGRDQVKVGNLQDLMQKTIIGKRIDDGIPFLQELLSGPFDADKLDYMARDARMSGVPVISDVDRLIRKVRAIQATPDQLPPRVLKRVPDRPIITITGVARSGYRTLDELTLGRTLLFDKIYRHHKVRSAEALVASIFELIASVVDGRDLGLVAFSLADDHLLDLNVARLEHILGANEATLGLTFGVLRDLSARLRERRLLVRALAFAQKMPSDAYEQLPEQDEGLAALQRDLADMATRRALAVEIATTAETALAAVDETSILDLFPSKSLTPYVWVDPPRTVPSPHITGQALLITRDGAVLTFDDEAPETAQWAMAYHQTRDIGYVFAPPEAAHVVALATERVFWQRWGVRLPKHMLIFGSGDEVELTRLRRALVSTGFYDGCPRDLLPPPHRFDAADVKNISRSISARLRNYQGPEADRAERGKGGVTEKRVMDFLAQFEEDSLISAALGALDNSVLIGRSDLVSALGTFLSENPAFDGATLVPLGSAKDSSAQNSYFALDLAEEHDLGLEDLEVALAGNRPILFVDDFIGSGQQSAAIVDSWMGNLEPSRKLGESRRPLREEFRPLFDGRMIGFLFAAGLSAGAAELRARCAGVGLDIALHIGRHDDQLPRLDSIAYEGEAQKNQFIARCADIGKQLRRGHGDDKAEERALGYGNHGLLVLFSYNTPSQTLTCLWDRGTVDGRPWVPLAARRPKR